MVAYLVDVQIELGVYEGLGGGVASADRHHAGHVLKIIMGGYSNLPNGHQSDNAVIFTYDVFLVFFCLFVFHSVFFSFFFFVLSFCSIFISSPFFSRLFGLSFFSSHFRGMFSSFGLSISFSLFSFQLSELLNLL